jgi:DNA-binding transcriptional LysR family regulator
MRHEFENRLGADQLAALAAVIEFGSFDAAADRLHVTPSAVSQRIKALEQRVGQVLVVREKPCRATPAGIPLLRQSSWPLRRWQTGRSSRSLMRTSTCRCIGSAGS